MAQNQIHNLRTHTYPSDEDQARFWDDAPRESSTSSDCISSTPNKYTHNPHFNHLSPLPHSSGNFNPALTSQHRPPIRIPKPRGEPLSDNIPSLSHIIPRSTSTRHRKLFHQKVIAGTPNIASWLYLLEIQEIFQQSGRAKNHDLPL